MRLLVHIAFSIAFPVQFPWVSQLLCRYCNTQSVSTSFHFFVSVCSFLCFCCLADSQFTHCIASLIHYQIQISCTRNLFSHASVLFLITPTVTVYLVTWPTHFSSISVLDIYYVSFLNTLREKCANT